MANYDNQNQDRDLNRNQGQAQNQGRDLEQGRSQAWQEDRQQDRERNQDRERSQDMDRAPDQMMSDKRAQQGQQQNALRDEHSSETSLNRQHGGDLSRQGVERNRNAGGFDGKRDR